MAPRTLWLLVLICFLCGCGSMKPARLPEATAEAQADRPELPEVRIGDHVTVEQRDGTRTTGRLCAISADDVSVEVDHGFRAKPRTERLSIPRAAISAISKERTDPGRTLLLAGGFVVGFVAIVMIDLAVNGRDFGGGN